MEAVCRAIGGCSSYWRQSFLLPSGSHGTSMHMVLLFFVFVFFFCCCFWGCGCFSFLVVLAYENFKAFWVVFLFFFLLLLYSCKHLRIRNWTRKFPISISRPRFFAVLWTFSCWYCCFCSSLLLFFPCSFSFWLKWRFTCSYDGILVNFFVGGTRHWWGLCLHCKLSWQQKRPPL